ncbi:MAG: hypothetical protein IKP65_02290 [Alphaproteobacteria bacterium]|nr:hypothetical protein [Alphaproteobacteria bacterium]
MYVSPNSPTAIVAAGLFGGAMGVTAMAPIALQQQNAVIDQLSQQYSNLNHRG